ncbi:uncharacterized protein Z518_08797 [Rhinocladiella mackenziei CBS 650.93]|uniref:Pentatricopeptide repeat protein n=1 Tax=Rhinocladiella mackenziei CBS 650.93 TaxID=1442369 RepID=A0A0D2IAH6_9EURO|nr:uncharacterized protein Z518_08797 [Rhinocladiella mackenziei CBS 650.93]KIX02854.1 hypothetical protein Z518_08797 [Rhinocladiella mackenziei CBS 650.93]
MLTCSTSLRRELRLHFFNQPLSLPWTCSSLPCPILTATTFVRNHATLGSIQLGHHRRLLYKALLKKQPVDVPKLKKPGLTAERFSRDADAREQNRTQRLTDSARANLEKAMEKESQYLVDPLKLAQSVVEKLRNSEFEAALSLVRASEKARDGMPVDNVVSWNHIMDWLMSQGSPSKAWKVYHEMKKRGHKPDSHTYTIMLRGYRDNVKKPNAVKQAVDVYNSIFAANSAVTATTIHTNAILSVCARANDIETLWAIAGRLPDHGPGAPDHITFTTILQAISAEVQARAVELSNRNKPGYNPQVLFNQAIDDARKLWVDITTKWRKGDLQLDEALVCAMGRLLMLSDDAKTHEDVLNLVQQTMNIQRFPRNLSSMKPDHTEDPEDTLNNLPDHAPSQSGVPATTFTSLMPPPNQLATSKSSIYAVPGRNTLSMLLETTTALRQLSEGKKYWELLTSPDGPYRIKPDYQNITAYLRLLRVSRSSQTVLNLLREPWSEEVQGQVMSRATFVIAMSTCLRDKKNPNVFDIANRLLDMMQGWAESTGREQAEVTGKAEAEEHQGQRLRLSPKVLTKYLELAMSTTKGLDGTSLEKTKDGDLDFERDPHKNNTLRALKRLSPHLLNVKQLIKLHLNELDAQARLGARTVRVAMLLAKRQITPYVVNEDMEELAEFLRTHISAYDKILMINERLEDDGLGPLEQGLVKECWEQKRKLSAFLGKLINPAGIPEEVQQARRQKKLDESQNKPPMDASGEDSDSEGLDLTALSQRTKFLEDVEMNQKRLTKSREEGGLSRRQKIELKKAELIRAQFPVSMLRAQEKEEKRRKMALNAKFRTGKPDDVSPFQTDTREMKGWGSGFENLARKHGQDGRSEFVHIGP